MKSYRNELLNFCWNIAKEFGGANEPDVMYSVLSMRPDEPLDLIHFTLQVVTTEQYTKRTK